MPGLQHDEQSSSGVEQEEMCRVGSTQEHQGSMKKTDNSGSAFIDLTLLPSCFDVCLGDSDATKQDEHATRIRSSKLCHRAEIRDAISCAKESKIRWAGHFTVMTVGPGRLLSGSLGTSCEHQDGR
ncbi:hypothetical protein V3C99_015103, partial [Haemonchus contortus]